MATASILVDLRTVRCGTCKVALQDELATECPVCHCTFDRIRSNHAGLANKFREKREKAGVTIPK